MGNWARCKHCGKYVDVRREDVIMHRVYSLWSAERDEFVHKKCEEEYQKLLKEK
jgi:hypothetical protein